MRPAKYTNEVIKEAWDLYDYKIGGQKVYAVRAIPYLLQKKFDLPTRPTRPTLYKWINSYKNDTKVNGIKSD